MLYSLIRVCVLPFTRSPLVMLIRLQLNVSYFIVFDFFIHTKFNIFK